MATARVSTRKTRACTTQAPGARVNRSQPKRSHSMAAPAGTTRQLPSKGGGAMGKVGVESGELASADMVKTVEISGMAPC